MKSRVKVSTAKLLAAVYERRARMEREYEKELVAYEPKRKAHTKQVTNALMKALTSAEKGDLPDLGYKRIEVPFRGEIVTEPYLNTVHIDRLIATLEMAAEESLTISAEDAARYIG